MDSRAKLEQTVMRGQQAKTCLPFFDEYMQELTAQLVAATLNYDEDAEEKTKNLLRIADELKHYLQRAVSAGVLAEVELKEAEENG